MSQNKAQRPIAGPSGANSGVKPDAPVIGIVVGRTNCSISLFRRGRIEFIENERGSLLTPNCVAFTTDRNLKGQDAKDQASLNPQNTITAVQRLIGKKYEEIANEIKNMGFKVINQKSIPMIEVEYKNEVKRFTADGILGILLTRMKEVADSFLGSGSRVTDVVICYQCGPKDASPASLMSKMKELADSYLNRKDATASSEDPEIKAVKNAASLAGLKLVELIEKPVSAAYAFGLHRDDSARNILVFHCGGETTFATILSKEGSGFKERGTVMNVRLGGNDFDDRLLFQCKQMFKQTTRFEIPGKEHKVMARLREAAAKAKVVLSKAQHASVQLDSLYRGKDFRVKILRSQFEDACADLFYGATALVDDVMREVRIEKESISQVIMIGGSCKIPKIEELLIETFDPDRILKCDHVPAEFVAGYGTAVRAATIRDEANIPKLVRKVLKVKVEAPKKQPPAPKPRGVNNPVRLAKPLAAHSKRAECRVQGNAEQRLYPALVNPPAPPVEPAAAREPDSGIVIGIDLGTTYSCVGIWKNGAVEIIPDKYDNHVIPSCVAFKENHRVVGYEAKLYAEVDPENVVFEAKRLIGRKFNDATVQADMKLWPFMIVNDNSKPKIEVSYMGERQRFHAEDISAFVLSKLKEMAEEYTNKRISKAVITVPAYFNDFQRVATKKAAQIAGLQVLKIINEPTAAAIAYGLDFTEGGHRTILVYDLGGGTFDVSILEIAGNDLQVKATAGDTHLGGEDFDNRIVSHFASKFMEKHAYDIRADKKAIRRLRVACEKAKVNLSAHEESGIDLDLFFGKNDYKNKITRAVFENLCQDLFDKTIVLLADVLKDAKMSKEAINDVVLVGGSTRIPKIQQMVKAFFNGKELKRDINPDEAVAYGAVMQSAMMEEDYELALAPNLRIRDVTPLSLGIGISGEIMQKIIPRNTPIPVEMEETFYTDADNQEYAYFDVLQGERTSVRDNTKLGDMIISGIPPARRSRAAVSVVFCLDQDGVLLAKARTSPGSPFQTIRINDPCDLSADEIERMIMNAEEMQEDDRRELERVQAHNELHAVCYDHRNDARIGATCQQTLQWLQRNPNVSREVLITKMNEVRM